MTTIKYGIKVVWPDWYLDELREKRVGFSATYENYEFVKGGKLLVYLTEIHRIMGIYQVIGNFQDGQAFPYDRRFPLRLPVELEFDVKDQGSGNGIDLAMIQSVVPHFRPHKGLSIFSLSESEFDRLQQLLRLHG